MSRYASVIDLCGISNGNQECGCLKMSFPIRMKSDGSGNLRPFSLVSSSFGQACVALESAVVLASSREEVQDELTDLTDSVCGDLVSSKSSVFRRLVPV